MKNSILYNYINKNGEFMETIKPDKEYNRFDKEADKYYDKLKATLNKEQIDCLNNFADANLAANCEFVRAAFKTGFMSGVSLIVECLCDDDMCNT